VDENHQIAMCTNLWLLVEDTLAPFDKFIHGSLHIFDLPRVKENKDSLK
jgi:hypothetical protein